MHLRRSVVVQILQPNSVKDRPSLTSIRISAVLFPMFGFF